MAMTNADKLHVEPTPMGWTAYFDPEGLSGHGKDRAAALEDLLDQTDEAWRKALDERSTFRKALPRWIPVTERLPDADSTVLGTLKDNSEPVWLVYHDGESWVTADGSPATVTHWMDLPEPAK